MILAFSDHWDGCCDNWTWFHIRLFSLFTIPVMLSSHFVFLTSFTENLHSSWCLASSHAPQQLTNFSAHQSWMLPKAKMLNDYDESMISRKATLSKYSYGYSKDVSAHMVILWNVSFLSKAFCTCNCFKALKIQEISGMRWDSASLLCM